MLDSFISPLLIFAEFYAFMLTNTRSYYPFIPVLINSHRNNPLQLAREWKHMS